MSKKETRYTLERMLAEMRQAAEAAGEKPINASTPKPLDVKNGRKVVTKELVERIIDKVERI